MCLSEALGRLGHVRIAVLVKYVPEVTSDLRFSDTHQVVREGSDSTLNELDEHAVEAALELASAAEAAAPVGVDPTPETSASEVIAITMAPESGDLALRKAFQMGVNRGIRLTDDALADSDLFGTTMALAAAIRKLGAEVPVDLVVLGMASSDGSTAVLPALLANELGWPKLSFADSVTLANGGFNITRHTDDAVETLWAKLPAVLSVTDSANTVRTPNFKLIMAARKAPIETWNAANLELDPATVGSAGSRISVVETSRVPAKPEAEVVYDDGSGSGAEALVNFLVEKELV